MPNLLIPLKCPVCGGPVDRGALKCKYCDTWYKSPAVSDLSLDCNVIYANGKTFPDLKNIEIIETGLRNGTMTPNEARQKLGLSMEEAIEAINDFARRVF